MNYSIIFTEISFSPETSKQCQNGGSRQEHNLTGNQLNIFTNQQTKSV